MRSAPKRQKDSWTPDQLLHRQRFSKVNSFCKQFKNTLIPQIWNISAVRMSGYALFLKTNMPAFAPDGSLAYPKKLQFSKGNLSLPEGFEASSGIGVPNTIHVSW